MLASSLRSICASPQSAARGVCAVRILACYDGSSGSTVRTYRYLLRRNHSSMISTRELKNAEEYDQERSREPEIPRSKGQRNSGRLTMEQVLSGIDDGLQGRELPGELSDDYSPSGKDSQLRYSAILDPALIVSAQSKIPPNSGHVSKWNKVRFEVPHELDDVETTLNKVEILCQIVELGKSISRYSALKFAANPALNVEKTVLKKLDARFGKMYLAWKETVYNPRYGIEQSSDHEKFILPKLNWRKCVAPVSEEVRVRSKFFSLAEVVDIVFGYRGATLENAMWLQMKRPRIMILVMIVRKILMLEKSRRLNQAPNMPGLSLNQAADLQTIRRVVAQADANLNREMTNFLQDLSNKSDSMNASYKQQLEEFLKKVNRLNDSLDFLRSHALHLESKCLKTYRLTKETVPAKEQTVGDEPGSDQTR